MIVEFFVTDDGKFAYRYKARNGKVFLTSHGYSTYRKCVDGWRQFEKLLRSRNRRRRIRWSKELQDL